MRLKQIWILVLLFGLLPCQIPAQRTQKPKIKAAVQVIRGLKARRLFNLAMIFIDDQLNAEDLDSVDKSSIVLEQIQVFVSQAVFSTGKQRQAAWSKAASTGNNYMRANPGHPKLLLIEVQDALTHFAHGNLIQQEIAAEIVDSKQSNSALEQLRTATFKLSRIEKTIEQKIPGARRESTSTGELTQQELVNLKNNVRYRLAAIDLAKAQLFASDDKLNRIDALNQVLFRLDEVITQSNVELPLWWDAHTSKAHCLRLMNKPGRFNQLIRSLPKKTINPQVFQALLTERVHAAVDFGWNQSWTVLGKEYVKIQNPNPLLQLAVLRMLMADATKSDESVKQQRLSQATELVKTIEQSQGPYWGRRAEILLVGAVKPEAGDSVVSSDFEILIRQGDNAFRKSNFVDAIKAFSKAADFAIDSGRAQSALASSIRLAQCHEQLKQHRQAADQLFKVADRFVKSKSSPAVHLRGCWNLGKEASDSDQELIKRLKNQIAKWPESENTDQARMWLGNAMQKQGQWERAVKAYLSLSFGSPMIESALLQIESCINRWSAQVRKNGEDWSLANRKLGQLLDQKWAPIEEYNDVKQRLVVMLVKTSLTANAINSKDAYAFLRLITNEGEIDAFPRTKVWRVISDAKLSFSQGELIEQIKQLPNDPELMKECLTGMKQCLSERRISQLSDAIVMICNKATVDGKAKDSTFWKIEKAMAQAQSSDSPNGSNNLAALANEYPKSLRIQLAYARSLTNEKHIDAINQWRRLAGKVKKESDAWYEAKYNVVELMIAAGQQQEATKLVKYLQVTTASWNDSNWKKKFEKLVK